jgi:hypothetical protein
VRFCFINIFIVKGILVLDQILMQVALVALALLVYHNLCPWHVRSVSYGLEVEYSLLHFFNKIWYRYNKFNTIITRVFVSACHVNLLIKRLELTREGYQMGLCTVGIQAPGLALQY